MYTRIVIYPFYDAILEEIYGPPCKCELGLPIVIDPEEAAEQVGEEDEAMGENGTGDIGEFREDRLDRPRTADNQDCFTSLL